MCFNITLHDPGNNLTSGRVWKVGACAELPHQQLLPSPSFRSYSVYATSASESWIKKASYKHSSQMTWKDGRAPKKTCLCDVLLASCCAASEGLNASTNAIQHRKPFRVTGPDRISLGSFWCPEGDPNTLPYLHVELRAHGQGACAWVCGNSSLWSVIILWKRFERDEAQGDWKMFQFTVMLGAKVAIREKYGGV